VAQGERRHPHAEHSYDALVAMVAPVVEPGTIERIERVERGHSSTNCRVEIRGGSPLHLRLVPGGRRVAAKEVAAQRLVSSTVPVPPVVYEAANGAHPYYVARWIDDAVPLDRVLEAGQLEGATSLGVAVGCTLAAIHRYTFDGAGDLGEGLEVLPWNGGDGSTQTDDRQGTSNPAGVPPSDGSGYARLLHSMLFRSRAHDRLGAELTQQLWKRILIEDAACDCDRARSCLVHFDFNPKNLLVRSGLDAWSVAAVLDWEFAASADPLFDVGNFLRHRADYPTDLVEGFISGYQSNAPWITPDWLRRARFLDLSSQLENLSSPQDKPNGHRIARTLVRDFVRG
jgi:fructokinase